MILLDISSNGVPKQTTAANLQGVSMKVFSNEDVLMFSDEINATLRKRLGYRTPEELFEEYLDQIYQTKSC